MSATNTPQSIKIARKRGAEEQLPDKFIVQTQEGELNGKDTVYIRQEKRRNITVEGEVKEDDGQNGEAKFAQKGPQNELARRLFRLQPRPVLKSVKSVVGKRKGCESDVATFVEERKERSAKSSRGGTPDVGEQEVSQFAALERPLKRPSRQPQAAKVESVVPIPQSEAERQQMEALAEYLHEAAIEEVKRESRAEMKRETKLLSTSKVAPPRISGQRAKELHSRRVEENNAASSPRSEDVDMSDGDYIYDTYVLAPASTFDTDFNSRPSDITNVGYLVIAPEDQDLWEAYMDDTGASDEERNSDEEDENAEDYYGADYPEDEMSEDDEFDRGIHRYQRKGESEGEDYESDEGAFSDDGDDEVERMMNPFKYRGPRLGGVQRRLAGGAEDE